MAADQARYVLYKTATIHVDRGQSLELSFYREMNVTALAGFGAFWGRDQLYVLAQDIVDLVSDEGKLGPPRNPVVRRILLTSHFARDFLRAME